MEDNKFWVAICRIVFGLFAVIALAFFSYLAHEDFAISQMVKAGADPLRARCAFMMSQSSDPQCIILAHDSIDEEKK